jgi:hypothetical protein
MFKKLTGTLLLVVGYLLSPLCWWNDLVFNLPIAYGLGWLGGLVSEHWFIPGTIIGYWLTNLIGIVMMQFGAIKWLKKGQTSKDSKPKRELLIGLASSTAYTFLIIGLLQLHIIDTDFLFSMVPK